MEYAEVEKTKTGEGRYHYHEKRRKGTREKPGEGSRRNESTPG